MAIQLFSKEWFIKYQKILLWFLNTPLINIWFRWLLRIHGDRSSVGKEKISRILPNAIFWNEQLASGNFEIRTHNKFAKRLYYGLKPVWYVLHFLDWLFLDRFLLPYNPRYSFGFTNFGPIYPDAG